MIYNSDEFNKFLLNTIKSDTISCRMYLNAFKDYIAQDEIGYLNKKDSYSHIHDHFMTVLEMFDVDIDVVYFMKKE